jgi:hypothetical protein
MKCPTASKIPVQVAICVLAIGCALNLCPAAVDPEDELKAAVVLSFVRYAEWPPSDSNSAPVIVGVLGRKSLADALRRTLEGKTAGSRKIQTLELKANQDARGCQIIYLALTKVSELKRELTAFNESTRAITIGEDDKFLELGGAVNLHMTDGHVGFEVNVNTIESKGVTISSKLLRFGQVRRSAETP